MHGMCGYGLECYLSLRGCESRGKSWNWK